MAKYAHLPSGDAVMWRRDTRRGEMGAMRDFRELGVYEMAMDGAMSIFEISKGFSVEEKYS